MIDDYVLPKQAELRENKSKEAKTEEKRPHFMEQFINCSIKNVCLKQWLALPPAHRMLQSLKELCNVAATKMRGDFWLIQDYLKVLKMRRRGKFFVMIVMIAVILVE